MFGTGSGQLKARVNGPRISELDVTLAEIHSQPLWVCGQNLGMGHTDVYVCSQRRNKGDLLNGWEDKEGAYPLVGPRDKPGDHLG